MEIKTIKIEQKFNVGNYESKLVSLEAVMTSEESASDVIAQLFDLADWHGKLSERQAQHKKYSKIVENDEDPDGKFARWLEQYDTRKAIVDAL